MSHSFKRPSLVIVSSLRGQLFADQTTIKPFLFVLSQLGDGEEVKPSLPTTPNKFARSLTGKILKLLDLDPAQIVYGDPPSSESLVIVDHNIHHGQGRVIACFDHHQETESNSAIPSEGKCIQVPQASTCTLVAMIWLTMRAAEPRFCEDIDFMKLGVNLALCIRVDAYDFDNEFKVLRWTDSDLSIYDKLKMATRQSENDMSCWREKVRKTSKEHKKYLEQGGAPLVEILLEDNKVFRYHHDDGSLSFLIYSSVPVVLRNHLMVTPLDAVISSFGDFIAACTPDGPKLFVATSRAKTHRELSFVHHQDDARACALMNQIQAKVSELEGEYIEKDKLYGSWVYSCVKVSWKSNVFIS